MEGKVLAWRFIANLTETDCRSYQRKGLLFCLKCKHENTFFFFFFWQYLSSCHEDTAFSFLICFFQPEAIYSIINPADKEFKIEIFSSEFWKSFLEIKKKINHCCYVAYPWVGIFFCFLMLFLCYFATIRSISWHASFLSNWLKTGSHFVYKNDELDL